MGNISKWGEAAVTGFQLDFAGSYNQIGAVGKIFIDMLVHNDCSLTVTFRFSFDVSTENEPRMPE